MNSTRASAPSAPQQQQQQQQHPPPRKSATTTAAQQKNNATNPNGQRNKELPTSNGLLSSDHHNDSGYETHGQQSNNIRENSSESGDSSDQNIPRRTKTAVKRADNNKPPHPNGNASHAQKNRNLDNSGDSDLVVDESRYELISDDAPGGQKPGKARLKTAKARRTANNSNEGSPDVRGALNNENNNLEPLPNSVAGSNTSIRSRGSDAFSDKKVSFKEDLVFESNSNNTQNGIHQQNKAPSTSNNGSPVRKAPTNGSLTARDPKPIKNSDSQKSNIPFSARDPPLSDISSDGSNNNNNNNNKNNSNSNANSNQPYNMADGSRNFRPDEEFAMWQRVSRDNSGRDTFDTISMGSTRSVRMSDRQGWASSRDDSGYETYGRKFTRLATKNSLGSSTTLSSTNEGDENDDVFNVVLRVRPLNDQESTRKDRFVADFPGDGQVSINNSGTNRNFQFNVVFEPDADQEDVFESSGIKKLVENSLAGYSCTAFAFGQTGSGKTHTMTGPPAQFHQEGVTPDPSMYGLMQRSFKYLFQLLKKQGPKVVRASYMEVYNEQVIDLLNNSHKRYLAVRWSKNRGFYVENLFTVECTEIDDLMAVLEEGLRNRQTGSHGLNEFSSRSHSVLTVTVDSESQAEGGEDDNLYITKRGKLSFVDLAGSEKVKDANSTGGPGMVESNSINKSLLVLGNCISHLGDPKRRQGHIPYRDSKLTKLLADSLGGNGITLMVACITPSSSNTTETLNTLRYASRAKKIKTRPTVKMDPREKLIVTLKKEIKVLRSENHYLRQQLDFPAKPKGQLQKENDEKFMKFMKETQQKESGMYEMLQEYMVENEALRAENNEIQGIKDKTRREQQVLNRENEKLAKRVDELERIISEQPNAWAMLDHHRRTDGYSQNDLSPRGSPVNVTYFSASGRPIRPTDIPIGGGNKVKIGSPVGHPKKPPHRLQDHVTRPAPRPIDYVEDAYVTNGYMSPRQTSLTSVKGPGSPHQVDRKASQVSHTDVIRANNEKLKKDLLQLEGEIQQHARIAHTNTQMKFVR